MNLKTKDKMKTIKLTEQDEALTIKSLRMTRNQIERNYLMFEGNDQIQKQLKEDVQDINNLLLYSFGYKESKIIQTEEEAAQPYEFE